MAKYRKKPIVVEAEQFFPNNHPYPKGVMKRVDISDEYFMDTLEGPYVVTSGDYIITGVKGEKYPCKPDIFEMTYDLVEEGR